MNHDLDLFIKAAGDLAAQEAERLWALDVFDPKANDYSPDAVRSRAVIEDIIRTCSWEWTLPYRGPEPQWCGLFGGKCWREAGLDPTCLATYWPSTYRLGLWFRYKNFSASKPNPPPAQDAPHRLWTSVGYGFKPRFTPRRGDVVIVGDGNPDEGDHVTILVGYDETTMTFTTISGNGGGFGPRGNKREGISKRDYTIGGDGYRVMFIGRPAPSDVVNFRVERQA